jgi:hypothetical protein
MVMLYRGESRAMPVNNHRTMYYGRAMAPGLLQHRVTLAPASPGSVRRSLDGVPCCRYWDDGTPILPVRR